MTSPKQLARRAFGLLLAAACMVSNESSAFEYTGDEGPAYWHELDSANASCTESEAQSPIDIPKQTQPATGQLVLDIEATPIHLENTGHNLEQEYEPGSSLTFSGKSYDLLQFHFHTLSEHTVHGRQYPMELHAVFQNPEPPNDRAVIGVLFTVDKTGEQNEFLASFPSLPAKASDPPVTSTDEVDLGDLLTPKRTKKYFTYAGSLTTPPCTDNVTWILLSKRVHASAAQLQAFRDVVGNNFRPLQPLNDRTVGRK